MNGRQGTTNRASSSLRQTTLLFVILIIVRLGVECSAPLLTNNDIMLQFFNYVIARKRQQG